MRQLGEASLVYLRASNVYLLAVTKRNSNAMMIMQFLSRVRGQSWDGWMGGDAGNVGQQTARGCWCWEAVGPGQRLRLPLPAVRCGCLVAAQQRKLGADAMRVRCRLLSGTCGPGTRQLHNV